MILAYEWPEFVGEDIPDVGIWLDLAGDLAKPELRGVVARADDDGLTILIKDGQDGSAEFQRWVLDGKDIGVRVSESQRDGFES